MLFPFYSHPFILILCFQEQINKMRQEYERIQLKMKEQLKRPTPLDRIKKFFSRKFKRELNFKHIIVYWIEEYPCVICLYMCILDETGSKEKGTTDSVSQRPVSSLSLHSSCSKWF